MFSFFKPRCLLPPAERAWLEHALDELSRMFTLGNFAKVRVVVPTEAFFPDRWDASEAALRILVERVGAYMGIPPGRVLVEVFDDRVHEKVVGHLPSLGWTSHRAAGTYQPHAGQGLICLAESKLGEPMELVATVAHELGHVLLLGDGRVSRDRPDQEPLTDLLTVALGLGVFNANAAFRVRHTENGWGAGRLGYLSREMFAHALGVFARARGEARPDWFAHLDPIICSGVRDTLRFLQHEAR